MKKRILLIAAVFASSFVFGQDLTSKKGETILPEEGDYALGFDAAPFLNYVGNFLNSGATSPTADFATNNMAITGKMFADAQTAYRGSVRIGFGSASQDILFGGMNGDSLTDNTKTSYNAIVLGGGIEKRRGNTRVQGLYGGELLINLGGGKTVNEYAQDISATNPAARVTEAKVGGTFGLGVRGFAGVEVFVFPKTSIGFEYGWGLGFTSTGEGESTSEFWNGTAREEVTTKTGGSSTFGIDTDNGNMFGTGGRLNIIFHF